MLCGLNRTLTRGIWGQLICNLHSGDLVWNSLDLYVPSQTPPKSVQILWRSGERWVLWLVWLLGTPRGLQTNRPLLWRVRDEHLDRNGHEKSMQQATVWVTVRTWVSGWRGGVSQMCMWGWCRGLGAEWERGGECQLRAGGKGEKGQCTGKPHALSPSAFADMFHLPICFPWMCAGLSRW